MTGQPATPTATPTGFAVERTRDGAPEDLKHLVAALGVAAETAASRLADDLEQVAAQMLALAGKVCAGESIRAGRLHPDHVSRLALQITDYQARREAWVALTQALPTQAGHPGPRATAG
ncbi:hypothetical protein [Frankia sp. AgKG'84/4]|uniref:hypothetical protein n=1 Tax=Frankia sp. AgKG'84/4 TaxID=573490 RepID=UPI00200EEF58|nr:hypothetical protein [Frankia sp. AgKG'84/4]MCL9793275.1 hypothetical protein [Frankia sp. AgKG'84/4]